MKGIARADGNPFPDYEAVVMAFSRLTSAVIADHSPGCALAAAAESGSVLLQADCGAAFLRDSETSTPELAATYQIDIPADGPSLPGCEIVEQCLETGSPVVLPQVESDSRKTVAALAKCGVTSVLCVPLKAGDNYIGALMVMSKTLRAFSASDIAVLGAVAEQAGFASWKSKLAMGLGSSDIKIDAAGADLQLIELANRKIQELSIINKVSEAVISTLDLTKLLNLALDQCLIAVGATVGSIMLVDEDSGLLSIKAAKGLPMDVIKLASIPVGEGIAGWVAENGQPVLVHDARNDSRFKMHRYRDDITSAMSVPLKARGRVIGVLNASTVEAGRRFGPREVEFLSTVANQAAMAIDNAQLYDRLNSRSKELASLLRISETITSTLELREVLELLSDRFKAMAQVDAAALLVFDADTGRFRCLDGQGLSKRAKKTAYLELAQRIAVSALEAESPVVGSVTPGSPYASEVAESVGLSSAVGVPLIAGSRVVGVVALFSEMPRAFPSSELQTLAALGKLAGVAVHNALIYQHKYEIARSLQFRLVPNVPLTANGLEIGHKFSPAREVGGDYYDLLKVMPGRTGIVIADVSGNSVPAAMYTSMGKNVLRAYALDNDSPADVIRRTNRIACEETQAEVFISLFYGVFDSERHTFRYACAGHEPPLLCRPDGSYETLRADGLLVGISPEFDYEEKEVVLDTGSVLVMYTDGLVDSPAVRGKFGVQDIREIVQAGLLKPAQELADNIYARLMDVAGSRVQDDVALVVLKAL